eukprot:jgi/Botrbrau1/16046/Bobra.7_2s0020.1
MLSSVRNVDVISRLASGLGRRLHPFVLSDSQFVRWVWGDSCIPDKLASERFYDSTVERYALQPIDELSLAEMLKFGRSAILDHGLLFESARMAQRELPKRLARRLMDLQFLPYIVVTNPHIKQVYDAHYHAFNTLIQLKPVDTPEENEFFTGLLKRLVDEHAPVLDALATGLRECSTKPFVGPKLQLDEFLDSMLRSRISRRVIAEQHLNLMKRRPGYIGVICTDLSLSETIDFAVQRAKWVCTETYGICADVKVTGDVKSTMQYIPTHLDYMLYELLKNAMRAVVENHPRRSALPPVVIRVCNGGGTVTLRISDQGGGIPEHAFDKVWKYGYTTMVPRNAPRQATGGHPEGLGFGEIWTQAAGAGHAGEGRWRMGGLGFGLPLSRLYARYFGGELQLVSIPGFGVDAYLTLEHLEDGWREDHVEDQGSPLIVVEELSSS